MKYTYRIIIYSELKEGINKYNKIYNNGELFSYKNM